MAEQHYNLQGVLSDKLVLVADYQRPYAWRDKQLRDLWDDLDLLGKDHHYAGTLVLQRTDDIQQTQSGQDLTVFEVVDGQQRLTTCLILLSEVRRHLGRYTDEDFDGVVDAVAELRRLLHVNVGGVTRPRLRLGAEMNEFFAASVLGDEVPDQDSLLEGQRRLLGALQFFRSRIEELVLGAERRAAAERLIELRARVCFRLRFLVYDVDSSAEVGVLFETLNERGQSLSELEKVKNYLLYLARQLQDERGKALTSAVNQAWSEIFKNLSGVRVEDDTLLRAHWLATRNPDPRAWNRIASVKSAFPRARYVPSSVRLATEPADVPADGHVDVWQDLYEHVDDYVSTLRKSSAYLRDLYTPNANYVAFAPDDAARARRFSAALVRSGSVANFMPLLLAARLAHPDNGRIYGAVVELCETFSARAYSLCRVRSNAGQADLARAAHSLYKGANPNEILATISSKLWWLADDDSVRASFRPEVDWYWRSHKYVLYEYELALAKNASDLKPFEEFQNAGPRKTTEHILPQHPADGSRWWQDFTAEDHQRLCNGIGNLVLTYDNSAYSNFEYEVKRGNPGQETPRCYFSTSALAREREIAQRYATWTPEAIMRRAREIEEWALRRWHVEPPAQVELPDDTDEDVETGAEVGSEVVA